jgi:uncharacterized membrane protein YgcG
MNPVTSLILSIALLLGGAGAVFALESAANHGSAATAPASHARPAGHHGSRHRTVVRWAPCTNGSHLEAGVCVTDVVHTVTLPAPAAPAVSHSSTSSSSHSGGSGEHGEHEHEGGGGGGGDD